MSKENYVIFSDQNGEWITRIIQRAEGAELFTGPLEKAETWTAKQAADWVKYLGHGYHREKLPS